MKVEIDFMQLKEEIKERNNFYTALVEIQKIITQNQTEWIIWQNDIFKICNEVLANVKITYCKGRK